MNMALSNIWIFDILSAYFRFCRTQFWTGSFPILWFKESTRKYCFCFSMHATCKSIDLRFFWHVNVSMKWEWRQFSIIKNFIGKLNRFIASKIKFIKYSIVKSNTSWCDHHQTKTGHTSSLEAPEPGVQIVIFHFQIFSTSFIFEFFSPCRRFVWCLCFWWS